MITDSEAILRKLAINSTVKAVADCRVGFFIAFHLRASQKNHSLDQFKLKSVM